MKRTLLAVLSLSLGCVAQVRGSRTQAPFYEAPEGTQIALVGIEVPPWVAEGAPKTDAPEERLKSGILAAFKGRFVAQDATTAGWSMTVVPDSAPIILPTGNTSAELNQPYAFDADGIADAVGVLPITWKLGPDAPEGLSIDPSGKVSWTPRKVGPHELPLIAVNARGETPYPLYVTVAEPGKAPKLELAKPGAPSISSDQKFTAVPPTNVPASIGAPLLLAVKVLDWKVGTDPSLPTNPEKGFTDVVYSLWTREGRELETTRVRLDATFMDNFTKVAVLVPEREYELRWTGGQLEVWHPSSKQVMTDIANASAIAFAWPYTPHPVMFSAQLDEAPALKPGIELSNKGDYEGAYRAFAEAAKADPKLAGAYFNQGVMAEVLGRDAEAAELYNKALEAKPGEDMYRRQLTQADARQRLRKPLPLQ